MNSVPFDSAQGREPVERLSPQSSALGREWLEADGLGGFASGTANGIRTRRYHALLLVATTPPTGRFVLVNGLDAWVETANGCFALSSQQYAPDVIDPDGAKRVLAFEPEPWPRWQFRLDDGTEIEQEIFVRHGAPIVAVSWHIVAALGERGEEPSRGRPQRGRLQLHVRPFLSGRDYHLLHRENPAFRFDAATQGETVTWQPYESLPKIVAWSNGAYEHQPLWYRNFLYQEERARGLDDTEDLGSPGIFCFDLTQGEAVLVLTCRGAQPCAPTWLDRLRAAELARRRKAPSRLRRSADAYIVRRGNGKTIVAGYPWFTDWGRDTFIALRGLCLATGRLDDARHILLEWAGMVSGGMLPNCFPDRGEEPIYNSVDASLWFVVAADEYLQGQCSRASVKRGGPVENESALHRSAATPDSKALIQVIESILSAYAVGTRHGIRLDSEGLLAAGEPGVQLTWMDAKVGDWVVTPRIGKPVEVQALWLNALKIGSSFNRRWNELFERGCQSFRARFWNESGGCLYDVVDVNHSKGEVDASFRPNQIFAVGGLPFPLLEGERARRVVDAVEARLWTPVGLRSLAQGEPGYAPRYEGGVRERDAAYHNGTVWPWLIGPFVEAWVRVRGRSNQVKREARQRFLEPLLSHLDEAGLGHISEIADGDPPHAPRGCPFQAWSVGEALRLSLVVLAEDDSK